MSTDTPSIGSTIPLRVHHQAPRVVASPSLRKLTTGPLYRLPGLKSALPTWAAPGFLDGVLAVVVVGVGLAVVLAAVVFPPAGLVVAVVLIWLSSVFSVLAAPSPDASGAEDEALWDELLSGIDDEGAGSRLQPAAASASSRARTAANARRQGFLIDIHIPFANGFIWRTGQFFRLYQRSI